MNLTFEELYKFAMAKNGQVYELDGTIKKEYAPLLQKVEKACINNPECIEMINRLRQATSEKDIEQIKELFQIKFGKKEDEKEKTQEEIISEVYGISLESIEHFRLDNGKEYYKFYDKNQNKDFVIEQNDKNKNLSEEFKEIQEQVSDTQKYSEKQNSEAIFNYQRMHTNNEVELYTPYDLENRPDLLNDITVEQMRILSVLLKNKDSLRINVINPKLGIAIDENHKIISVTYDLTKNEYNITYPEEYKYTNDIEQTNINGNIEDKEVSNDNPETFSEELIDEEKVKFLYEYPEAINRTDVVPEEQREAYLDAVEKYKQELQKSNEKIKKEPQKVYVKKYKYNQYKKAGFMNTILLALLTGFAGGVITMVVYNIIK